jgi:transcriptional regulator NrdR family protein
MYQFQKKDGRVVDFDQSKIISGIIRAGGSPTDAQAIIANIQTWLPTVAVNNVVKAADMRTKVLAELQIINPTVAASFAAFKKA